MGLAVGLAALLTGLVAITAESLWIDEFASLQVADRETLRGVLGALFGSPESDGQMPLYMLWLWAWIGLFGTSEWVLRAANIPWFALAMIALVYWNRRARFSSTPVLVLLVCLSPFLWFYLNEVRPYIMQFSGASLFLGGVLTAIFAGEEGSSIRLDPVDCRVMALGAVLLCGSSLLGVPWLLAGLVALAISWRTGRIEVGRCCLVPTLVATFSLGLLAVYYVGTLLRGAGPYINDSSFILTFGFALYELLGYTGLGPSRLALRESGPLELVPYAPVLLAAFLVWIAAIGVGASRAASRHRSPRRLLLLLILLGLPLMFFGTLSELRSFRVLGRHLTPLLSVLLLALATLLSALRSSSRRWHSVLATAALLLWAVSAVSWRVSERHRKDDYKLAAHVAAEALRQGQTVWWAAHYFGGAYYGLPLESPARAPRVLRSKETAALLGFYRPKPEDLAGLGSPDLLILSKPDTYDGYGALEAVATGGGYRESMVAPAFRFFERETAD